MHQTSAFPSQHWRWGQDEFLLTVWWMSIRSLISSSLLKVFLASFVLLKTLFVLKPEFSYRNTSLCWHTLSPSHIVSLNFDDLSLTDAVVIKWLSMICWTHSLYYCALIDDTNIYGYGFSNAVTVLHSLLYFTLHFRICRGGYSVFITQQKIRKSKEGRGAHSVFQISKKNTLIPVNWGYFRPRRIRIWGR